MSATILRRTICPEIKVLDKSKGIVEYVASDQSLDADREIVLATGWRFNRFAKNAPFVDGHNYSTVEKLLGKVIDFEVKGDRLIETAQWAIDVEENRLARLGFKMTEAGFLKAVSVGFQPIKAVTKSGDSQAFKAQLKALGVDGDTAARTKVIFLEQEQLELSAVIIGANPNALAKAYKAEALSDEDLEFLAGENGKWQMANGKAANSQEKEFQKHERETVDPNRSRLAQWAATQRTKLFLDRIERAAKSL